MTFIVETVSGSIYYFKEIGGKPYIICDVGRGIVVSNTHPNTGYPMKIVYRKQDDRTGNISEEYSHITTYPVKDVTIEIN